MKENYFSEPTDNKLFILNPDTVVIFNAVKKKQFNSRSTVALLSFMMLLSFVGEISAQTTLWSTGFETGNTVPLLTSTTASSFSTQTSGGNFAPKSVQITAEGAPSKTYDGSVITSSLSFTTGKYYVVTVYAKATVVTGLLHIMKSSTATNAAMKAATGSNIILNASSNNVISSSWVKYTAGFTVTSNETKYIGFQMLQSGNGGAQMILDDISIVEYDSVQPESYCTPTYSNGPGTIDRISNVTLGTLNNASLSSTTPFYTFYNSVTIPNLTQSSTASVSVTMGSDSNQFAGVWIDFNQDGVFQTSEGAVSANAGSNGTVVISIPVPAGAIPGNTRMRVRGGNDSALTTTQACGTSSSSYGETEDYIVNIVSNATCLTPTAQPTTLSLAPTTTTIAASFTMANPLTDNYLVVVNTSGVVPTPVNGTTYSIGSTALGGSNVVADIDSNNTFTATGLMGNTLYYVYVFSYNSLCSGGPLYKTTSPLNGSISTLGVYCTPSPTSVDGTGITNVSFSTVNNTTTAETSNYGDYTAMIGTGIKGTSVPINITTSTLSYAYQLIIWVDWNDDFDFNDVGENVYSGSVTSATLAATIAIPSGATIGNHRIRIGAIDQGMPTTCYVGTYGAYEDYTLNVTAAVACTLAPTVSTPANRSIVSGGTTTFTSTIANGPDSIIWELSTDGGTNYSIITDGGIYTTASTATLTITAAPSSMTGFKYRVKASNACGSTTSTPGTLTVTRTYCTPSSTTATTYINGLATTGTLQDVISNSSVGYNTNGYDDNSSIILGRQIPGGAINLNIDVEGPSQSFISVFIDWNADGDFVDAGEKVYTTGSTATNDTSFGFIVPISQTLGNYRMRVRTRSYGDSSTIIACDAGYSTGEAEDFTISIVSDCASKISSVTGGTNCGIGAVILGASSGGGATEFKWYSDKTGGTLLETTVTGSWTTPSIPATTTYYVSSYNGSCESLERVAVKATIYPVANIAFSPALPTICGSGTILTIGASGDSAIEDLFTEDFEGGALGNFTKHTISNVNTKGNTSLAEEWNVKTSSYLPTNTTVFKPAINSGGAGTTENKFAFTTSDTADGTTVNTAIESVTINTSGFTNLTLTFDHYYADYGTTDKIDIEVSTDGGTTWSTTPVITYTADDGSAGNFENKTVDFTPFINQGTLKFRFRYTAGWDEGYALDNVKLFGTKPLASTFVWGGANVADLYSDINATIPYDGKTPLATVYAKPNVTTATTWDFTAQTTLPNGCIINKTITVPNNTKIWNGSGNSNYNSAANWYPPGKPTASNCVEISNVTPNPIASDQAFAYNLTLTNAASVLNITSGNSIIVTDKVTVTTGGTFNIANNASLVQINNVANTGIVNVERITPALSKLDYTYWSSPVSAFTLGGFSASNSYMYSWTPTISNGGGNWSQENDSRVMSPGKGYIIRTPNGHPSNTAYTARFTGIPNNGNILVPISKGANANMVAGVLDDEDDEWNLIGNPYPSGLSIVKFIDFPANVNIIDGTVYIWTHNSQPSTAALDPFYGDYVLNYTSEDYATVNKTGATVTMTTATTGVVRVPTGYIAAGQSFFIKSANGMPNGATANATFSNDMREANQNNNFFKLVNTTKKESILKGVPEFEKDRIWLNLTNNSGAFSQTLIGYVEGATQGLDRGFDGESFGGNDVSFYSVIPQAQLAIQGRGLPFDENEQIILGYNAAIAGKLSIRIDHLEGVFSNQNIYLQDKELNVLYDLKDKPYDFNTKIGEFNDRFVLRFTDKTLGIKEPVYENDIQVDFIRSTSILNIVNSSRDNTINTVSLFDILGKSISKWEVSEKEQTNIKIPIQNTASGVYIVKLKTIKGTVSKKIIVP